MGSSSSRKLPELSLEEVEKHNTRRSCWIVRGKKVYDVTKYVSDHPGGERAILGKGGGSSDCTVDFQFHSSSAQKEWKKFEVGKLSEEAQAKFKIKIAAHKKQKQLIKAAEDAARPAYIPRCAKRNPNQPTTGGQLTTTTNNLSRRGSTISTSGTPKKTIGPYSAFELGSEVGETIAGQNSSFGSVSETVSLYSSPPTSTLGDSNTAGGGRSGGSPVVPTKDFPVVLLQSQPSGLQSTKPQSSADDNSPLGGQTTTAVMIISGGTATTTGSISGPNQSSFCTSPQSPLKDSFRRTEASSSTSVQQRDKQQRRAEDANILRKQQQQQQGGGGGGEGLSKLASCGNQEELFFLSSPNQPTVSTFGPKDTPPSPSTAPKPATYHEGTFHSVIYGTTGSGTTAAVAIAIVAPTHQRVSTDRVSTDSSTSTKEDAEKGGNKNLAADNSERLTHKNLLALVDQGKWVPCACGCDGGIECKGRTKSKSGKSETNI